MCNCVTIILTLACPSTQQKISLLLRPDDSGRVQLTSLGEGAGRGCRPVTTRGVDAPAGLLEDEEAAREREIVEEGTEERSLAAFLKQHP